MTNGWWRFVVGILIGALAPSLIAWGSMSASIKHNTEEIDKKVFTETFLQYKEGNIQVLELMQDSLKRIEDKLGTNRK